MAHNHEVAVRFCFSAQLINTLWAAYLYNRSHVVSLVHRQSLFMLNINTLKVAEHRGCKIYIRNFYTTFEYLTYVNGEMYQAHMEIVPSVLRTFRKDKYTSKQLTDATKYLLNVAQTTIDHVLGEPKEK